MSFADGYPYLVVNEASFREVQRRCGAGIKIEQFRGNIIVTGAEPFAEDRWKTIQVGDVVFDLKNRAAAVFSPLSVRIKGLNTGNGAVPHPANLPESRR